ncbi:11653_t:CDS:2, partial [Funneliformis geosporum]
KYILDVQVDADLTSDSILHLVHLFDKAEKTSQKEKLLWYYYIEATSSFISISTKTFETTMGNVKSALENVNDTLLSPVIIPPPNLQ